MGILAGDALLNYAFETACQAFDRDAGGIDGAAAHQAVVIVKLESILFPCGIQDLDGLADDLRADAVAPEDDDLILFHDKSLQ